MKNTMKKIALAAMTLALALTFVAVNPTMAKASDVTQTAATANSATLTWTAYPGATCYYVRLGSSYVRVTGNTYTFQGLPTGYANYCYIYACNAEQDAKNQRYGSVIYYLDYISSVDFATTPVVGDVLLSGWESGTANAEMVWDINGNATRPDGYEVTLKNAKGQVVFSGDCNSSNANSGYYVTKFKNCGFAISVRAYFNVCGDGRIYGPWTADKRVVPQPKVKGNKRTSWYRRTKTYSFKWGKVKGAKTYSVYRSKTRDGKYKKVATVKGTKFSQTVKSSDYYYYRVIANKVPVCGKRLNSTIDSGFNYIY